MIFTRFFGHDIDFDLAIQPFTWQHYLIMFLGVLSIVLTLKFADKLKTYKYENRVRIGFTIWLLFLEMSYHLHYWLFGMFSIPLHICSFGVMLSIVLLSTNSKKVFEILFFVGIFGGLLALFIPNTLGYTYFNMRYYHFIFLHISIAIVPVYYFKAYGFRIRLVSIYKTFGYFLLILPLVVFVNYVKDKNYMFIGEKPDIIANLLPEWPYYIIIFVFLAFIMFHLLYLISNNFGNKINQR